MRPRGAGGSCPDIADHPVEPSLRKADLDVEALPDVCRQSASNATWNWSIWV